MGPWFVKPAILAIAALVLISPRALRTPALWAIVAAFVAVRIADDWPLADNHIYLIAYWTLAIALSLRALDLQATLATTSRWLLGMAFAFAVLWKAVLSPDFLDGRFFRVTLLTDPRFAEAAMLIGGLSDEELKANREALTRAPRWRRARRAADRHRAGPAPRAGDRLDVGHRPARGDAWRCRCCSRRGESLPGCVTGFSSPFVSSRTRLRQ